MNETPLPPPDEHAGVNHCFAMRRLTRLERVGRWLFPQRYVEMPGHWRFGPGKEPKDVLVVRTCMSFCWKDRIRLLFSGRAIVETRTFCENVVGENKTFSKVDVFPPQFLDLHE